jgi:hypothetical protein
VQVSRISSRISFASDVVTLTTGYYRIAISAPDCSSSGVNWIIVVDNASHLSLPSSGSPSEYWL